jgi:hypothetical protein
VVSDLESVSGKNTMKIRLNQLIKYFPKSNLGKELLICYNIRLTLLSIFSKVKVKK